MTSIDRSVILNRILPFIVLKVWFFSTTTGKDFCDCIISSMKGAIRRCCNEGCKILTAAGMHEALKVRQVKGSSAAVCEIYSGKKETKTKRINNFSFFHNFVYGKNGLHLSKPMGSAWAHQYHGQRFVTAPGTIKQNQNHGQKSSYNKEDMLFHCPEQGYCSEFTSSEELQDHTHLGEHSKREASESLYQGLGRAGLGHEIFLPNAWIKDSNSWSNRQS